MGRTEDRQFTKDYAKESIERYRGEINALGFGRGWTVASMISGLAIEIGVHFYTLKNYIDSNESFDHYLLRTAAEQPFWETAGIFLFGLGLWGTVATSRRIRKYEKKIEKLEREVLDLDLD